jgi:hypothetical protein
VQIEINPTSPTYGGGTLGIVGDFLIDGLPDVGGGIEKIEIEVLLRSQPSAPRRQAVDDMPDEEFAALLELITEGDPSGPGDAESNEEYHERRRSKGPSLTFRRSARRVSMRILSDLSELDVFGTDEVAPEVFARTAREVVGGLEDLRRRIKPGDDCDAHTLLSHLRSRLEALPETQEELRRELERLVEASARRWEAMDDWERLDVDWSVFAPDARERFDDPFFFDPGDEDAPHGNDAGSDFLAAYLDERPTNGLAFLEAYVREMGYESLSAFAADTDEYDDLVIAAPFAELMVRGSTSTELIHLALQALDRREAEAPSPRYEQMRRALN